jgi:hypothetical protein
MTVAPTMSAVVEEVSSKAAAEPAPAHEPPAMPIAPLVSVSWLVASTSTPSAPASIVDAPIEASVRLAKI